MEKVLNTLSDRISITLEDKSNGEYIDLLIITKLILKSYDPNEYISNKEEMKERINQIIEEFYEE